MILIVGGSGYVGQRAREALGDSRSFRSTSFRRSLSGGDPGVRLDIRDREAVARVLGETRPSAVIHLACDMGDLTGSVLRGTQHLMEAWEGRGRPGRFIFASTDMVFDGEAAPYREGDEPRPIFDYGRVKRDAEIRVLSGGGTVVRISLVYGWSPMDPRTSALVAGLRTGRFPHPYFSDEIRCPIFVDDLAEALVELAEGAAREESILHLAGPEPVSRYEFARRVAEALGLDAEIIPRALLREAALVRPADLSLDVSRACTCLATPLRGLDETLPLLASEG